MTDRGIGGRMIRGAVGLLLGFGILAAVVIGGLARTAEPLPVNSARVLQPPVVLVGTPFGSAEATAALDDALGATVGPPIEPLSDGGSSLFGRHGMVRILSSEDVPATAQRVVVAVGRADAGASQATVLAAIGRVIEGLERTVPAGRIVIVGPTWPTASPPADVRALRDVWRASAKVSSIRFVDPLALNWRIEEEAAATDDLSLPTDRGATRYAQQLGALLG